MAALGQTRRSSWGAGVSAISGTMPAMSNPSPSNKVALERFVQACEQALQQLLVAAQSDPNDPRVFVYLADTYSWLGMDAEAKQAAERAKQLDPNAFDILR